MLKHDRLQLRLCSRNVIWFYYFRVFSERRKVIMKSNPKPQYIPHFSGSFDSKLKEAISRVKGVPYVEKIKLFNSIISACQEQIEDCCDSLTIATYIVLHDDRGFGQQRINQTRDRVQQVIDEYVERYDIGTLPALFRDLKERNIIVKPRWEE